jgi:hypothetical protein
VLFSLAFLLTAILFKLFLYLRLQILHADFLGAMSLLACFEGFGVKIFMYGVNFVMILFDFEMLVGQWVESSADDAHLVFSEPQIFDAVCVFHDFFHSDCQLLQGKMGVLRNIDVQLLQLFENALASEF